MKKGLVIVCFVLLGILIFEVRDSYSLFETSGSGKVSSDLAKWRIKVNNTDITRLRVSNNSFDLGSISWDSRNHVVDGKAAPGSVGCFDIIIDPSGTDVSFMYEITLDFSQINNMEFQLSSVSDVSGNNLIRTGEYSYAGIAILSDIKNNKIYDIRLEFVWNNSDDNNDSDYVLGKSARSISIPVTFSVSQYTGVERIVEYDPEVSDNNEIVG